jgi:hypothetical protein
MNATSSTNKQELKRKPKQINKKHNMLNRMLIIFYLLSSTKSILAQHQYSSPIVTDTNSLRSKLLKGKVEVRFRMYMMTTDNTSLLTDYSALAFGGGLHYESGEWNGLSLGVSGFFIWNLASTDLSKRDPVTGAKNRYEIGQFDVENPENRNDMDRLEDFYINYKRKSLAVRFGKQEIKTPFINPQDGRMRPTGEQGFWTEWNLHRHLKLQGGWIYKISPRGTVKWYGIAESMGLYPAGVSSDGTPSAYSSNLESAGIGILAIQYQSKDIHVQVWEHMVEGIFHTTMLQLERKPTSEQQRGIESGIQYVFQEPLRDGGHQEPVKAYFSKGTQTHVVSAKVGWKCKSSIVRLNATHIANTGRFLMPREWGREPFYTFIPRERNEGAGGLNAITLNYIRENKQKKWRTEISYGYYAMPDVKNAKLNKYQMPSYNHLLADVKYAFKGWAEGLSVEGLYTYKKNAGETYGDPRYLINKVNMHHFNLILNYIL